jgi:hypothetical protein
MRTWMKLWCAGMAITNNFLADGVYSWIRRMITFATAWQMSSRSPDRRRRMLHECRSQFLGSSSKCVQGWRALGQGSQFGMLTWLKVTFPCTAVRSEVDIIALPGATNKPR